MATGLALVPAVGQSQEPGTSTGSAFAHENQPKLVQNLEELPKILGFPPFRNRPYFSGKPAFEARRARLLASHFREVGIRVRMPTMVLAAPQGQGGA